MTRLIKDDVCIVDVNNVDDDVVVIFGFNRVFLCFLFFYFVLYD